MLRPPCEFATGNVSAPILIGGAVVVLSAIFQIFTSDSCHWNPFLTTSFITLWKKIFLMCCLHKIVIIIIIIATSHFSSLTFSSFPMLLLVSSLMFASLLPASEENKSRTRANTEVVLGKRHISLHMSYHQRSAWESRLCFNVRKQGPATAGCTFICH